MTLSRVLGAGVALYALYLGYDTALRIYRMEQPKRLSGYEFNYTARSDGSIGVTIDFAGSGHHYAYVLPRGN